jgi:hypothetical protein
MNMSAYDNYIAGLYNNTLPYPQTPKRPRLSIRPTAAEAREFAKAIEDYDILMDGHRAEKVEYGEATRDLEAKLRADLEKENEVTGNPKAGRLWEIAWEQGHSGGYGEVINAYNQLVDLIL